MSVLSRYTGLALRQPTEAERAAEQRRAEEREQQRRREAERQAELKWREGEFALAGSLSAFLDVVLEAERSLVVTAEDAGDLRGWAHDHQRRIDEKAAQDAERARIGREWERVADAWFEHSADEPISSVGSIGSRARYRSEDVEGWIAGFVDREYARRKQTANEHDYWKRHRTRLLRTPATDALEPRALAASRPAEGVTTLLTRAQANAFCGLPLSAFHHVAPEL